MCQRDRSSKEVHLLELRQRDHERRASESEEQRAQQNESLREYRRQISLHQKVSVSKSYQRETLKNFKMR